MYLVLYGNLNRMGTDAGWYVERQNSVVLLCFMLQLDWLEYEPLVLKMCCTKVPPNILLRAFLQSSFASEHQVALLWILCWSLLCCYSG